MVMAGTYTLLVSVQDQIGPLHGWPNAVEIVKIPYHGSELTQARADYVCMDPNGRAEGKSFPSCIRAFRSHNNASYFESGE